MAGMEVLSEDRVEQDEAEIGESVEERTFVVGELVGFWEGSSVRRYRTDSGEPAWVMEDYGGGVLWYKDGWEYKREIKKGEMDNIIQRWEL
jgi:hypothetical protein